MGRQLYFTPNFSYTCSALINFDFKGSYMLILSSINCIRSLSEEIIVTLMPWLLAVFANVAIRSSASKPCFSNISILSAETASLTRGNWGINSSGAGGLWDLYSGYIFFNDFIILIYSLLLVYLSGCLSISTSPLRICIAMSISIVGLEVL